MVQVVDQENPDCGADASGSREPAPRGDEIAEEPAASDRAFALRTAAAAPCGMLAVGEVWEHVPIRAGVFFLVRRELGAEVRRLAQQIVAALAAPPGAGAASE